MAANHHPHLHLLLIPYPFQGHFSPMINLAIKLASSFHVSATFVTTHHSLFRLLRSAHLTQASTMSSFLSSYDAAGPLCFRFSWRQLGVDADSDIRLVGIPEGSSVDEDRSDLSEAYFRSMDAALRIGIDAFLQSTDDLRFSGIVSDSFLPWTQDVANRLGIPRVFLWTQSVTVASVYSNLSSLGYDPFKQHVKRRGQSNSFIVDTVPGLPPIDHYDLPFDGLGVPDAGKAWVSEMVHEQFSRVNEADWVLVNSFEELEGSIVEALKPRIPKMLLVGPLNVIHHLEGKNGGGNGSRSNSSSSSSVFRASISEDDRKCMGWLDTKPESSVLFVSFGSLVVQKAESMEAISKALLNVCRGMEGMNVLWSCRNCEREMFPGEFWEEMVEKGGRVLLVKWAPQVEVLSHRAIGGFLSHMGWNSTMESVSMGVPMICCPAFFDQFTDSWCAVHQWEVGVEMHYQQAEDGGYKLMANEVEAAIRRVMSVHYNGEGEKLRKKASSLKAAASRAWGFPEGNSWRNLEVFVRSLSVESTIHAA